MLEQESLSKNIFQIRSDQDGLGFNSITRLDAMPGLAKQRQNVKAWRDINTYMMCTSWIHAIQRRLRVLFSY